MTNIKTGVDKLVGLVSEKKKISVDDTAKALGVGKNVVQEWAEFLEEEGVVNIEYRLSKAWISEKKITRDDVISSAREVASEKDAFARKIEVAINALSQETSGFEQVRKEFNNIQSHIHKEIDTVKNQLSELEKYEKLKQTIDVDTAKIKEKYGITVKEAEEKLTAQTKKYETLTNAIEKEKRNIELYIQKIDELKKIRKGYESSIDSLKAALKNIGETINSYNKQFENSSKVITGYRESLDKLNKDLSEKKDSTLMKKFEELKNEQNTLLKNQQMIAAEIQQKKKELDPYNNITKDIHRSFEGFFTKTIETQKLMDEIEKEKEQLRKEMEELHKRVLAFSIIKGNESIRMQLASIEEQIKKQEHSRNTIKSKIEKLIIMIKGGKNIGDNKPVKK